MNIANNWKDYKILDMADGQKLEKWGDVILSRPDPQIIWKQKSLLYLLAIKSMLLLRNNLLLSSTLNNKYMVFALYVTAQLTKFKFTIIIRAEKWSF